MLPVVNKGYLMANAGIRVQPKDILKCVEEQEMF
jgi:hypothetical protein